MSTSNPTPLISDVVKVLDQNSNLMSDAVVFGSALSDPTLSNDLDVAFIVPKRYEFGDLDKYRRLLRAGARGTSRYGLFDLFLVFDDCLWVRNGDCLGFERAKNAKSIRRNILSTAQPWDGWRQKFEGPLPFPPKPPAKPRCFSKTVFPHCSQSGKKIPK